MLISVRSAHEAQLVSHYPIAILDFKNPDQGALGAVEPTVLSAAISGLTLQPGTKISLAAGELLDPDSAPIAARVDSYSGCWQRISYCKVGLARAAAEGTPDWKQAWLRFAAALPTTVNPVLVGYLDSARAQSPKIQQLIDFAAQHDRCQTLLLDTFGKDRDLLAWASPTQLTKWTEAAHASGLKVVLAGSVGRDNLGMVASVEPDLIGVRGAVCDGDRSQAVDPEKLSDWYRAVVQAVSTGEATIHQPGIRVS